MFAASTKEKLLEIIADLQRKYGSVPKSQLVKVSKERGLMKIDTLLQRLVHDRMVREIVPNVIYSLGEPGACPTCIKDLEEAKNLHKEKNLGRMKSLVDELIDMDRLEKRVMKECC